MSYYKFEQNDIFTNRIKAHPRTYFLINNSKIYYNNDVMPLRSGSTTDTIQNTEQGYLSLNEININRDNSPGSGDLIYPFVTKQGSLESFKTVSTEAFQNFQYGNEMSGSYPMSASISTEHYAADAARPRATALKNTFNYYKPHSRHYSFETPDWNKATQEMKLVSIPSIFYGSSIKKGSVKMNFYVSGSLVATLEDKARNGELVQTAGPTSAGAAATGSVVFKFDNTSVYASQTIDITNTSGVTKVFFISINAIQGSTGTVDGSGRIVVQISGLSGLDSFASELAIAVESVSGFQVTAVDDSVDTVTLTQNTAGTAGNTAVTSTVSTSFLTPNNFTGGTAGSATNPDIGKVAGVVLYNEGFVALTGSWDISPTHTTETYESGALAPKWTNWGFFGATHSSWDIDFLGTNYIPTMTMFAHAKQGDLNHSNNPTFIDYEDRNDNSEEISLSPNKFTEDTELKIANVVKSPYANHSGSFEKTTYISKIGIYDEDKNLIGIAKLATPVKKTESRQYTFKMKIDF